MASNRALNSAVSAAKPGDRIVLEDGRYELDEIAVSGEVGRLVVVAAEHTLKAAITAGEFKVTGSHLTISGVDFGATPIGIDGNHVVLTRCRSRDASTKANQAAIAVRGIEDEISYCDVSAGGKGITVFPKKDCRTHIHHNYIHDFTGPEGNGFECVQIGQSPQTMNLRARCIVEYNLFTNTTHESEAISVKSSENIVRFNTMIHGRTFTLRRGRSNLLTGNWIEDSVGSIGNVGIVVLNRDHKVTGNVLKGGQILVMAGDLAVDERGTPRERVHNQASNVLLAGNEATVIVGYTRTDYTNPALNTRIEANQGKVIKRLEKGTIILPTTREPMPDARQVRRLEASEVGPFAGLASPATGAVLRLGPDASVLPAGIFPGMEKWWVEGGERVWVEGKRLYMKADNPKAKGGGAATAWCETPLPANFRMTVDAHVMASSIDANNINLFFCYSDPSGKPLFNTRASRRHAQYPLYHTLSGYIVTFINDWVGESEPNADGSTKARMRLRRNPGFELMAEKFAGQCRQGRTYRLTVTKRGGVIAFGIDGEEVLRAEDARPLTGGLLGLRTYRTELWWEGLSVEPITEGQGK